MSATCKSAAALLVAAATIQPAMAREPTLEMALKAPAIDLASAYVNSHIMADLIDWAGGKAPIITPEARIDASNADKWKKRYLA